MAELAAVHGVTVHRGAVGKWLHRLGLSHEKTLRASEILRPDAAERRRVRAETRQSDMSDMLERFVFIDETSLKTDLVKTTGWAPVIPPSASVWVLDGAMDRDSFDTHVARELAPALRPGQIVVADNPSSHKSAQALALLRAQGNDLIFLPPCPPDLNPIEMAFSKLKTLVRKAAARTCHDPWTKVGAVCDLFNPQECRNCFKTAGYGLD